MVERQEPKLPDNLAETLLVSALGKLLVRKGLLSGDEIIAELRDVQRLFAVDDQKVAIRLAHADIETVIQSVQRW